MASAKDAEPAPAARKQQVVSTTRILDGDGFLPEGTVLKGKMADEMLGLGHARREDVPPAPEA